MFVCRKCKGVKQSKQARCLNPCPQQNDATTIDATTIDATTIDATTIDAMNAMTAHATTDAKQKCITDTSSRGTEMSFWDDDTVAQSITSWEDEFKRHIREERCRLSQEESDILRMPFDHPLFETWPGNFVDAFQVMFENNL